MKKYQLTAESVITSHTLSCLACMVAISCIIEPAGAIR